MTLRLHFAVRSDVGLLRDGNEDAAYAGHRLLAVADGMGGHAAGEVASRLAIASVVPLDEDVPEADLLAALGRAVDASQHGIRERVATDGALEGMGTTLTALLWAGTRLGIAHVGDSRAYLLREGHLEQITHDHTYVQDLVDAGRISAAEADIHPQRSLLTRALDGRHDVEPDLAVREVRAGDRYLLCTDGLSGVVSAATMADALRAHDPDSAVDRLVELALRGGGPDNVTAVVADIVEGDDLPAGPMVAGAASDVEVPTRAGAESPAGRAALASGRHRRGRRAARPEVAPPPGPRRRGWRMAVGVTVLAVATLVAAGAWLWVHSQYYLGVEAGQVAIFRGVDGSIGGLSLHSIAERRDVMVDELPQYERDRLRQGISANGIGHARRIAARLGEEQQKCTSPVPVISAAPTPAAASPSPVPTPSPPCTGVTP